VLKVRILVVLALSICLYDHFGGLAQAQTIAACAHCAVGKGLENFPFLAAHCCKPGARPESGWENCDPYAERGWVVCDMEKMTCDIGTDYGGNQYCWGVYRCGGVDCDALGCFWYLGDPVPEGEEYPCSQGGSGWSEECQCC
jgi:hypothetical protein